MYIPIWILIIFAIILYFYNYAKPISNKEKSEATTTIEFQLALGYMPYGGNPADNPEGFTIWEQEWKKERQDRFSENFISLTTNLPDRFVNLVLFGKDAENEDGTDVEEAVPEQKLTKSEEEIVRKAIGNCKRNIQPVDISKMFAKILLKYAEDSVSSNVRITKDGPPRGANLINKFLEYWGQILLVPEHQNSLANIASFMKGDFEKLTDPYSEVLLKQKDLLLKLEELYKL